MLCLTFNRQKCRLRLTVKKFQSVSNLTISAYIHGIRAPKEFLNWKKKPVLMPKTTLSRQYSTLLRTCLYLKTF